MKRINIYTEIDEMYSDTKFEGWFNLDSAEEIASCIEGDLYKNGKILLATAKNKLVVNSWNNQGYDKYKFAADEAEIAEILAASGYAGDDEKMLEILDKYEL